MHLGTGVRIPPPPVVQPLGWGIRTLKGLGKEFSQVVGVTGSEAAARGAPAPMEICDSKFGFKGEARNPPASNF